MNDYISVSDGDVEISSGEGVCPQCKSGNINSHSVTISNGVACQEYTCHECACEWTLYFNLSSIVVDVDGDKKQTNTEHLHHP